MKKNSLNMFIVLVLLIGVMFLTVNCYAKEGLNDDGLQEKNNSGETRVVADHLKREVTIPRHPKRVLALNPLMMEDLFCLGIKPVGKVDDFTHRVEAEDLPSVGFQQSPNIEMIHALKPDIIFAHTRAHVQLLKSLESTGAAVVFINPSFGEDPLLDILKFIANVVNENDKAAAYVKKIDDLSKLLRKEINFCEADEALILQGGSETILAAQSGSFYGGLLSRLGIENIVPDGMPGAGKAAFISFDIEIITQKNPDIIFVTGNSKNILSNYNNDPQWSNLRAVREGRLLLLPLQIGPGKMSLEEALKKTANIICPMAFKE